VHLYQQLLDHPPINGVNWAGVEGVKRSFCVGDGADVVHGKSLREQYFLFSRLTASLPSFDGRKAIGEMVEN
jgi:hypothetical protein